MATSLQLKQNAEICILRLSAIGDVCHAAAMVTRIRQTRPDIAITWVIGKIEYQLLKGMDGVKFVIFDKKAGKAGIQAVKQTLNGQVFDVLCVMQVALRANWLSRAIKAKVKLGFDWARSKEGHSLFINKRIDTQDFPHVLEGFMAFADKMGIPQQPKTQWAMPLDQESEALGKTLVARYQAYAVICPAASKAERNWLPERYAAIADYLSEQGLKVVVCGGPGPLDRQLADQIKQRSKNVSEDLVGKTSLKQQLGVLKHAELVVAPATGPAHMARSVGTSVVGLYAHSNPVRTGPYLGIEFVTSVYDDIAIEQFGKPWRELPYGTRVKGDSLMSRIEVDAVKNCIKNVLNQNK